MKKAVFTLTVILSTLILVSQNEWNLIHPKPTINNLQDVHFNSDTEGWIVGTDGLIMYTNDGGNTWETQHSDENESFWGVFFIDESEGWVVGWNDIYHTTNKGLNWEKQTTPSIMGDLTDVHFINHDTGWIVGTYRIILETKDGGENWTKIMNSIANEKSFFSIDFANDTVGCAVGGEMFSEDGFVMRTSDGGKTWEELTLGNRYGFTEIHFFDSVTGWICGYHRELLKTTNAGVTWVPKGNNNHNSVTDVCFFDSNNGLMVDGYQSYLSFDGGETWDSIVLISMDSHAQHISSWDYNKCVVTGYGGTIVKTNDGGGTWESFNSNLKKSFINIGFFNQNNGYALVWDYPYYKLVSTYDGGYNWNYDTIIPNAEYYKLKFKGNTGYLLTTDNHMIKTNNAGETWEIIDIPEPNTGYFYTDIQFVNENAGYLCSYGGRLQETSNGGISWIDRSISEEYDLTKVVFMNDNTGWLIDYTGKNLLKTDNGGWSWSVKQFGDPYIFQPTNVFFVNDNTGYLITDEGILFKTTNAGETWFEDFVFPSSSNSIIYFKDELEGWIKRPTSVHHTIDGGETWFNHQGFSSAHLYDMFFLDDENAWIAGQYGLVARSDFTVSTEELKLNTSPVNIFPIPAKDLINIELNNSSENINNITIMDMSGKEMIQYSKPNTGNKITLDISSLISGTYIICVSTDANDIRSKLVVQ